MSISFYCIINNSTYWTVSLLSCISNTFGRIENVWKSALFSRFLYSYWLVSLHLSALLISTLKCHVRLTAVNRQIFPVGEIIRIRPSAAKVHVLTVSSWQVYHGFDLTLLKRKFSFLFIDWDPSQEEGIKFELSFLSQAQGTILLIFSHTIARSHSSTDFWWTGCLMGVVLVAGFT